MAESKIKLQSSALQDAVTLNADGTATINNQQIAGLISTSLRDAEQKVRQGDVRPNVNVTITID
jgi:type II secretory pathway component PulM